MKFDSLTILLTGQTMFSLLKSLLQRSYHFQEHFAINELSRIFCAFGIIVSLFFWQVE